LRDGSSTMGYFTGLLVHKFGIRILGSPFPGWTTSYMGLNLLSDVTRRAAAQILTHLAFEDLGCMHLEFMDRNLSAEDLSGWKSTSYRGFEIDLRQSEPILFANMAPACRRCIRKAIKCGVTVEECHDQGFADDYYSQLKDVFAKQKLAPTYGVERVRELIRH